MGFDGVFFTLRNSSELFTSRLGASVTCHLKLSSSDILKHLHLQSNLRDLDATKKVNTYKLSNFVHTLSVYVFDLDNT